MNEPNEIQRLMKGIFIVYLLLSYEVAVNI